MNSLRNAIDRAAVALLTCVASGFLAAQPLCDVLLRPAFHYTTDGLDLVLADSSSTYGLAATASWSYGDGTAASLVAGHTYSAPGIYTVCLTLTVKSLNCSSTYCREVVVPLSDCGGVVDALFTWYSTTTNTAVVLDVSLSTPTGSVVWDFGDGSTSDQFVPDHTWQLPGAHFVSLTRTQGECTATYGTWVTVDGNVSTCGPGLFVDFSSMQFDMFVQFQPSVVANGPIPVLSIWSYGDGAVDTTIVGSHVYNDFGNYQTCLLVGAFNPPSDSCFVLVCHTNTLFAAAAIEDLHAPSIRTWPNPFHTGFEVVIPNPVPGMVIRLMDPLGKVVLEQVARTTDRMYVDAAELPAGAYVLLLERPASGSRSRTQVIKAW